jgi:RimJ/RimL family protein N-acetyltransferase
VVRSRGDAGVRRDGGALRDGATPVLGRPPAHLSGLTDPATIVPARRDDIAGVIALIGRVFEEYGFVYDPAVEVPDLLAFSAHYEAPQGAFFVVRDAARIVGSVGIERVDHDTAELHRLYLDTALRGRGLGERLVNETLAWCQARAISRLILWSDTRFERAHRLYMRMGFRQSGERVLPGDANQTREYRFERSV